MLAGVRPMMFLFYTLPLLALKMACEVNALDGLTIPPTKPVLPALEGSPATKLATDGEKLFTVIGFMA